MGSRIRTLPSVMQIPRLASNFSFVSKMDNVGVKIVFEKETCKMFQGAMVLLRGVWIATLYKLLGSNISDGWNSFVVPKIGEEEGKTLVVFGEKYYVVA
jgi:hypothetical protein